MSRAQRSTFESLGVGIAIFAVYAAGACRTIYVGDSGELVAAAATLGIPHPSGYPLYVLLGKLWIEVVRVGSSAFRMSLFSAACAATAAAGLGHLVRRAVERMGDGDDGVGRWAGLFTATLLAFSPSFWSQANVQRVYALNAVFVVAVLALALRWSATRNDRWMVAAALATGFGAANHTVMALIGMALGAAAVLVDPGWLRRPRSIAACIGAAVAGLVPYLYLPLRSRQDPLLDWGDPETLDGFLGVLLRKDFWDRRWIEGPADLVPIFSDWATGLGVEFLFAGTVLAVVGVRVAPRFGLPRSSPLAILAVNVLALALHGSRSDIFLWHRYYIPSYVAAAFLAGLGAAAALGHVPRIARGLVLLVPAALLVLGWRTYDRSDFTFADDFSRTLLSQIPPGGHLSASDDNILFVLIYLHQAEGFRPDLDLILQGVGGADLPALRFDPDEDPLFFTHHPNWNHPQIDVVPIGLVFQTVHRGVEPELDLPKPQLDGTDDPRIPKDYLTSNLVGHYHYMLGLTHEARDWPAAQRELRRAMEIADRNDVLFYNLGLIYRRNGLVDRSIEAFERATAINPRHIASNKPVRPVDKLEETRSWRTRVRAIEREVAAAAGVSASPRTADEHLALGAALESAGEATLARGHRLLAAELREGIDPARAIPPVRPATIFPWVEIR